MSVFENNKDEKINAIVIFPEVKANPIATSSQARLAEAIGLALAINLEIVMSEIIKLREVRPSTFLGQGVIDRLLEIIEEQEASLLIVDGNLTPVQQRNLERTLKIKVIDRTALILEIFGERAQTKEGKLQVELAHLTYQRSRLVRSWTHLERQRGGAGFLGGPGETQIELDRRIIDDKIVRIKKDLEKVKLTRSIQRSSRQKIPYPVVALVGYTNAGKSSLFNQLSNADVFTQDLLFATLDPAMRKIKLPSGREVILSDTVGFISDLPHELIMSFRATLEEVLSANVVVHVRDIENVNTKEQKQDVINVLQNLGLDNIEEQENYLEVLNKIDLLEGDDKKAVLEQAKRNDNLIAVSAVSGEGCANFLKAVDDKLARDFMIYKIKIAIDNGKLISWVHENMEVLGSKNTNKFMTFEVRTDELTYEKFLRLSN